MLTLSRREGSPELLTLVVGPQKIKKLCFKAIVCFYSKFFEAVLCGGFSESGSDTIELPDEDIELINNFVHWTETGNLYSAHGLEKIWAFGRQIQCDGLSNEAMHAMFSYPVAEWYFITPKFV